MFPLQSEALERAAGASSPSLFNDCLSPPQSILQQVGIRIPGHSTHKKTKVGLFNNVRSEEEEA